MIDICVIPARGGSKRIPKKNIKNFHGKPIIFWSIEEAIKCNCFKKIIVSTDSQEIADLVKIYDVEVPFLRPKNISDDLTQTIPVVEHTIRHQIKNNIDIRNVCCIYPTAPFVRATDLQLGLEKLGSSNVNFVFSATEYDFPIQRAFKINQKKKLEMFQPQFASSRSQDLEKAYHDAGQFYWGAANTWLEEDTLVSNNSIPLIIPNYRVNDIDTIEDWKRAEIMFNYINKYSF